MGGIFFGGHTFNIWDLRPFLKYVGTLPCPTFHIFYIWALLFETLRQCRTHCTAGPVTPLGDLVPTLRRWQPRINEHGFISRVDSLTSRNH